MRGLLAQNEMSESLSSDLVSVLALGDVDPLGRSCLSFGAAIRRMQTNLAPLYQTCNGCSWLHELLSPFWMLCNVSPVLSVMQ